jgi:hypothetical protein
MQIDVVAHPGRCDLIAVLVDEVGTSLAVTALDRDAVVLALSEAIFFDSTAAGRFSAGMSPQADRIPAAPPARCG